MDPTIDYGMLAQALLAQMAGGASVRSKAVSSTPTGTYGHGPGGLFSFPGLSRPVFSAMVLPRLGLQSRLPVRPSMDANPLYGIFTGVTATTGSEPTGVCDDPPTAGLSKLCTHSFVFGRQSRQTPVIQIDRAGLWTNRGEFGDLQFMGNPWAGNAGDNPNVPTVPGLGQGTDGVLNNEAKKKLFELAVAWSRDFGRVLYTGNPTNNTSGGGYKEFYGLDILINTGYKDAENAQLCPAADSIVRSFGNLDIATNGAALVRNVTNMYRNLRYIASHAGLDPVKWTICMRWSMFYEITEVWPCAYLSYRCTNLQTGSTNFIDSAEAIKLRDDMRGDVYSRSGQYLLIDGERVEVTIDDAIAETNNTNQAGVPAGSFRSAMYFVPLTVLGGTPVAYLEYLNFDAPGAAIEVARQFAPGDSYFTSDNGRFLWHKKPPTNWCVQLMAQTQPRLLLLTPHLAARLTGIQYTPVQHEREPFTDAAYFVNGGRTDRIGYGPSYYAPQ